MVSETLVPQLKFKEFSENWVATTLGECCTKIQDGNYGADYPKQHEFVEMGRPFLTSKAIGNNTNIIREKIDFIAEDKHQTLKKAQLKLNDVLFTNRGSNVGNIALVSKEISHGNIGPQLTLLRANETILPKFLLLSMQTYGFCKQIVAQDSGSAMNFFGLKDTSRFKLSFPQLSEQQKIADFLTSVDTKISQLTEKHRLLKEYKKGVMQQIFSQQIRFKDEDGNAFPEWGNKRLGDLTSKVGSGSTPKGGSDVYVESGITFIRSQNVYGNILDLTDAAFITEDTHQKMKGSLVKPLDVLLNITGASIGRSCVVPEQFTEANVNQHVCIIRPKKDLDPHFLQLFLSGYLGQKAIFQSQAGGGREGLNFVAIRAFKCPYPHLHEQQKIAQFLQSIDNKIETVAEQIEQAKQFKKGLLQQMFV